MAFLIAVSGLSGSGKTTAVNHLKNLCGGQSIYLGGLVLEEVKGRGLALSAGNEQLVRLDIRKHLGPGALAILAGPKIKSYLNDGLNVLVDAIFVLEEYQILQRCCENSNATLLAIDACFETRSGRLSSRTERPLSRDEVKARDDVEIRTLKTPAVMAEADFKIVNENSIQRFFADLESFWMNASSSASSGI